MVGKCERCTRQRQRRQDEIRGNFRQRGYTTQWDKLRKFVLSEEPLCRHCKANGIIKSARVVDHIIAIAKGGAMWDRDNLQPLCDACNAKKSIEQDGWLGASKRNM